MQSQRVLRPRGQVARSNSGNRHSTGMYFSEVEVTAKALEGSYNVRSSEDISSGYSSAEPVSGALSRTSSMTGATRARTKAKRTNEEKSLVMSTSCTTLPRSKKPEKVIKTRVK
ncbi:REEP2.2 family protein [Megaselia abdita]